MTDAERIDAAVAAALPIPGWMSEAELRHLAQRATTCKAILEIGSFMGRSTKSMAVALPPAGVIYAIDDWRAEESTPVDPHELRSAFMSHLMLEIIQGKVMQYTATSQHFALMLRSGWLNTLTEFDLIFVDGSHDRTSVMDDVSAYIPYVRRGGILAGHDFGLPGVNAGLRAVLPDAVPVCQSIWEWRRG